jgi:Putative peptidoglycan binding domain
MGTRHEVTQGEHVARIAEQCGFADYRSIWNHPDNAELKKTRQNPNVLFPSDVVMIPDRATAEYSRPTDERHTFRKLAKPLALNLKLERAYDGPVAGTPCELSTGPAQVSLTTDGDGRIGNEIPKTAESARLVVRETIQGKNGAIPAIDELDLRIGWMDPVEERSGQIARLTNLGYYRGSLDQVDEAELLSAIEEFQCEHSLTVDGKCGPATQAKLKEVHGC